MMEPNTLGARILGSRGVGKLCLALGIDPRQYRLLLGLFSLLSDRLEFMGTTVSLKKVIGGYVFISLLLSLIAFANPPLHGYLLIILGSSMLFMFMILTQDVANSIMNPDEASVLAHQPIRGATYVAAKLTHVFVIVAVITSSLNALPAIAGLYLRQSHWFYPLTHLMAAYLAGLFIAFLVCGIYGWLFLFIAPAKLKNAALWLQLLTLMIPTLIVNALQIVFGAKFLERTQIVSRALGSSWMPWRWFVALGLMGHTKYPGFSAWEAGAACLITCALIAFGLRGFRADYLIKVSALIQGSATSAARSPRGSWLNPLVRKLAGAPSGYGAFSWVCTMVRRDWNFRLQAFWNMGAGLILLLLMVVKGIRVSPFASGAFSPMHAVPHVLGVLLAVVCRLMSYTAEPQGASLFVTLPLVPLRPFVRGAYLSLWLPAGILHLCLLGPCIWFWGVAEGMLFISFSMALASVYVGLTVFFVDGFPFANAFKPSVGKELSMVFLIMLIPIAPLLLVQWLIFHHAFLVMAAAIALAFLAFVAAHFSLGRLEKRIHANLQLLGFGPQQMFKELE
jgi:ABC-2 type transport system permease protein